MIEFLISMWYWYKVIWVLSFVLLFFRTDIISITLSLRDSFQSSFLRGFWHLFVISLVLPITLPFTLANILDKWL